MESEMHWYDGLHVLQQLDILLGMISIMKLPNGFDCNGWPISMIYQLNVVYTDLGKEWVQRFLKCHPQLQSVYCMYTY